MILTRIRNVNTISLIGLTLLFNLAISFIFAFAANLVDYSINANFLKFDSLTEELLVVAVLAPLLETFVYQYFLIGLVLYLTKLIFKKESLLLAIIIPAICFALSHQYNYVYVAATLIIGLSLNLFYLVVKERKQNAFMYTTFIHALYNFLVFTLQHISQLDGK